MMDLVLFANRVITNLANDTGRRNKVKKYVGKKVGDLRKVQKVDCAKSDTEKIIELKIKPEWPFGRS